MATGIRVKDVMKKAVITVKKDETMQNAAVIMARAEIGGLVVTDAKSKIVGIFTEGDVIKSILAKGKDYKKLKVKDVMSHPVRTIAPSSDIGEALRIMRDLKIERLPVVEKNKLIGIITERDITRIQPALIELVREKAALGLKLPSDLGAITGYCESCYNYSENLRADKEGRYICEDCRGED